MTLIRQNLPSAEEYFKARGHKVTNHGKGFRTNCGIHNGTGQNLSVRDDGAFYCFKCGAKGGDLISYEMLLTGADFVTSAKSLGAWIEDGNTNHHHKPTPITAQQALDILQMESLIVAIALTDYSNGQPISSIDAERLRVAAGRIWNLQRTFK